MYTVVQSKDKAPPGNRVGPYYSSVIFFLLSIRVTPFHKSRHFVPGPNGVHLRELTLVYATPHLSLCRQI